MTIWTLLLSYQLKHFLADYPFQSNRYMLGKFLDKGWVKPLAAHAAVHAAGTLLISAVYGRLLLGLALAVFDGTIHFVMDRLKAGGKYMGRWKALTGKQYSIAAECYDAHGPARRDQREHWCQEALRGNVLFWNALGLDQMVHHLTHYACIAILVLT